MGDRKLYHLVNGEFVLDGMPSMRIPTYEEVNAHIAILRDVGFFDDPVAESVTFTGLSNGKRNTEVQASVYDAMMAEIYGEKERRTRKYLRTHNLRNDGKPQKKDKRKSYRKELYDSCDPWIGYEHIRNFRKAEKIRTDAEDYALEHEEAEKARAEAERIAKEDAEIRYWEERIEKERELRQLHEWLKYA